MKAVPLGRLAVFVGIVLLGTAVDLATKSWIFARLGMPGPGQTGPIWIWPGVFSLTTSLNEGALFGVGQGWVVLFTILSVVAALGIVGWILVGGAAQDRLLCFALASIMAGIFGNLYDRLGLPQLRWTFPPNQVGQRVYAVRDWLHFKIDGLIDWPVFNIADSLLVVGAALLFWHAWRHDAALRRQGEASGQSPVGSGVD